MLNLSGNTYMQYFVGYTVFRPGQPFAPSLMVAFHKRMTWLKSKRQSIQSIKKTASMTRAQMTEEIMERL